MKCLPCRRHEHGDLCQATGCGCGCRAVLGLAGPFELGDPTVPWWDERYAGVA
jgi:hypothetical protein